MQVIKGKQINWHVNILKNIFFLISAHKIKIKFILKSNNELPKYFEQFVL